MFGNIVNGEMVLNEFGNIAKQCWNNIPNHFNDIELDEFQIMPNHIHGIIVIQNLNQSVGNRHACSLHNGINRRQNQLIPNIINLFKSTTSKFIHQLGLNSFKWQKSFYDNIIRNEYSLNRIRQYIRDNSRNWDEDENNLN